VLGHDDVPRDFNLTTYFVDRNVDEGRGDRTALIGPEGPCTYARLAELTDRIGNVLRTLGVRQESRVLLALSDSVEFVATWYAVLKLGGVTAEVYTYLQPSDYAYYLEYTRAEVVVVDRVTLNNVRQAASRSPYLRRLLVVGVPPEQLRAREASFDELVKEAPDGLDAAPTDRDDIAIWKFTTGSTGRPKACVHAMHTPLLSFEAYARGVLELRADDVVLPVPKLFFGYARDLTALYTFGVAAAGIVFPDRTTPERVFELIARYRPTILVNVPTMMRAMLDHPDAGRQDLSCLRLCTSAGEALPEHLHRRWVDAFGVDVVDGIGSSEAYHIYISNRPGAGRPGSLGSVVPGYAAAIVDDAGNPVPDGQVGRLWVRGPTAALMYWNDRAASTRTFAGDLVMSADLFERDPDGYFYYRGRADDLLKVGGIWVAPAEIESCLAGHPDVAECAVVGVDREGLTRSCAYVVRREGSELSAKDITAFAKERLSPQKVPREVEFVAELPRTGSGKIDRAALRNRSGRAEVVR
jgi:benzoate-CoA ligase family protein